jgi:hypothetical protein
VLYDGEVTEQERRQLDYAKWIDGYNYQHNWKVKAVLVFGDPIMGVRSSGGKGVQSGSKPLSWWGVPSATNPELELQERLRRVLPCLYGPKTHKYLEYVLKKNKP